MTDGIEKTMKNLFRSIARSLLEEIHRILNAEEEKKRWLQRISTYKYIHHRRVDRIHLYDHRPRTRIYLFIPYRRIQRPGDSD